jgi:hypothetical protein
MAMAIAMAMAMAMAMAEAHILILNNHFTTYSHRCFFKKKLLHMACKERRHTTSKRDAVSR